MPLYSSPTVRNVGPQAGAVENPKDDKAGLEHQVEQAWRYIQYLEFKLKHLRLAVEAQKALETIPPDTTESLKLPMETLLQGSLHGFEDRAKEINYMKAVFSFSPQKQLELTTTTSEVYTTQLTLRVDDTKDMAGLDNYLRVIRQSRKRVGVVGQASSRGASFKDAVDKLHAMYVQK